MKKNLFITGPVRSGKSTLLKSLVRPVRSLTGGYFVQRLFIRGETRAFRLVDLALEEYRPDRPVESLAGFKDLIAVINSKRHVDYKVFETIGVPALGRALREKQLVVMDELGRFETKAPVFMRAVFTALDSGVPVLGVIKNEHNFFLDRIRARADVQVLRPGPGGQDRDRVQARIQEFLNLTLKE